MRAAPAVTPPTLSRYPSAGSGDLASGEGFGHAARSRRQRSRRDARVRCPPATSSRSPPSAGRSPARTRSASRRTPPRPVQSSRVRWILPPETAPLVRVPGSIVEGRPEIERLHSTSQYINLVELHRDIAFAYVDWFPVRRDPCDDGRRLSDPETPALRPNGQKRIYDVLEASGRSDSGQTCRERPP